MADVHDVMGLGAEVAEKAEAVANACNGEINGSAKHARCIIAGNRETLIHKSHGSSCAANNESACNDTKCIFAFAGLKRNKARPRLFHEIAIPPCKTSGRDIADVR